MNAVAVWTDVDGGEGRHGGGTAGQWSSHPYLNDSMLHPTDADVRSGWPRVYIDPDLFFQAF